MPHKWPKLLACEVCGCDVVKRPRADRRVLCLDCAIHAMSMAAMEMRDKRGPAWDAWLASNADGAPGPSVDTLE